MGIKGWNPGEDGAGRLEIVTRAHDRSWLVAVRGEIDLATIGALEAELEKLESRPIILDLSGVSFIDSTGLTLLIRTAGRVTIGAVSATVNHLIQTCGLETELRFAH
jgi:anti-anti-sigma factor